MNTDISIIKIFFNLIFVLLLALLVLIIYKKLRNHDWTSAIHTLLNRSCKVSNIFKRKYSNDENINANIEGAHEKSFDTAKKTTVGKIEILDIRNIDMQRKIVAVSFGKKTYLLLCGAGNNCVIDALDAFQS